MDCIALMDSGNYALSLCRALEKKGYVFEVVATPCRIARSGCGYSLRFPFEYMEFIIREGAANNTPVKEIYSITELLTKNKYQRIY